MGRRCTFPRPRGTFLVLLSPFHPSIPTAFRARLLPYASPRVDTIAWEEGRIISFVRLATSLSNFDGRVYRLDPPPPNVVLPQAVGVGPLFAGEPLGLLLLLHVSC